MAQTLNYTIGADRRAFVKDIQNFKIDFADDNNNWVQARQFERGMRQVFVNILNEDHTPFDMTGCNVWFEGLLPENSKGDFRVIDDTGFVPIDLQNGQFRFDLPGHAFAVAGSYRQAFFRIVKNGQSVTTLEFDLQVLADKVIGGLVPRTYISPLEQILEEVEADFAEHTKKFDDINADFKAKVTNLFDQLSKQGTETANMLTTVQARLGEIEEKIKAEGLFTQEEAKKLNDTVSKNLYSLKENVQEMVDFNVDFFDPIPDPYNNAAKDFVTNLKSDLPSILLVQDLHYDHAIYPEEYNTAVNLGVKQLAHLRELDGKINAVILNGDITHGRSSKENVLTAMEEVKSALDCYYPQTDRIYTMGNHDANTVYAPADRNQHIAEDELKKIWGVNQLYAVKDIGEKLRLIALNAYEISDLPKYPNAITSLFKADQLRFLASSLETNRDVLVFMHCPPQGFFGNQPYPVTYQGNKTTIDINHDVLLGIMQAFAHKESTTVTGINSDYPVSIDVDYSSYNGHLAGIITGHEHLDRNPDEHNGVIVTTRINNLAYSTQAGQRNWGTVNADAFDVIQVDVDNRTVFFKRFGYGNDLSYRY